jgi:hypothetical protein
VKLDIVKHKSALTREIANLSNIKPEVVKAVMDGLEELVQTKLPCSKCGRWLPHQAFHKQAGAKNRYGRIGHCRLCQGLYDPKRYLVVGRDDTPNPGLSEEELVNKVERESWQAGFGADPSKGGAVPDRNEYDEYEAGDEAIGYSDADEEE